MKKDGYVLLNLHQESQTFITSRKSLWRSWNQLSRLQRNLICGIASMVGCLIIIYHWRSGMRESYDVRSHKYEGIPVVTQRDFGMFERWEPKGDPKALKFESNVIEEPEARENFKKRVEPLEKPKVEEVLPPPQEIREEKLLNFTLAVNDKQKAVISAFKHAWSGYREFAWGYDHLKPISMKPHDWFRLGLTIVDSLDTMYIMGLTEELMEAREWIANGLNLNKYHDVNLFEVTIRVLGGLLSAYHLTNDNLYLDKAKNLGERLLPCFTGSPSPIPYSDVNLASHTVHSPRWGPDSSTSEVTTLQLEFRDLSRAVDDPKFENAAFKVSHHVHGLPKTDGLVPIFINPRTGQFQSYTDIKLGARGDSYYEYLVKQWIQTGKTIDFLRDDYVEAVAGIRKRLVRRTPKSNLLFIGELKGGTRDFVPKMDHLVCYLPGTLALGYAHGLPEDHLELAEDLMNTCYHTYSERPTFLAPEITYFNLQNDGKSDLYVKMNDAHNLLRPEFIESLWYMYQITGNTTYQDWGWKIFQSIEKYAKVEHGYTSIGNVNNPEDVKPRDMMESFFLSETLKYLYLLFSDDRKLLDVHKFVVNSEGHPLPIHKS
ncbi:Endoplasmic reticulum mannosyl-oligosaccharide [Nesidiocoris tenuis]|uniref:alpha-1,2-Mannosidase n=1 Tax=Nesidiocoris tenuis TaxID=355587 RepID=A0ABN7BDT8_9HEMI|nr:Endoplasmic reticulum mannosyl-oligosaccharide [Nesidiocoris tenuis]